MRKYTMLLDQGQFCRYRLKSSCQLIPVALFGINGKTELLGPQPVIRLLRRRLAVVQNSKGELCRPICDKQIDTLEKLSCICVGANTKDNENYA